MCVGKESPVSGTSPNLVPHAFCPQFRIAIVARRRNLRAAPPRIERVIGPLYRRVLGHTVNKLWKTCDELKKKFEPIRSRPAGAPLSFRYLPRSFLMSLPMGRPSFRLLSGARDQTELFGPTPSFSAVFQIIGIS